MLSVLGFQFSVLAAEQESLSSGPIRVNYTPGHEENAHETAAVARDDIELIARELGIRLEGQVDITLVITRNEFNDACGETMPNWALAAALPENRIVVDISKTTPSTPNDIHLAMLHEMVHLALHVAEKGRADRLPLWFHEGCATWLSGRRHMGGDTSAFETAAAHGRLIPLKKLTREFPADASEADLAYAESESFIGWLSRYTPDGIAGIVKRYRAGRSFDDAFLASTGMSVAEAERRWSEPMKKSFPWLWTILRSFTFWTSMAIATVVVFFIVRWRSRKQMEEWKEEDRIFSVLDEEEPPPDEPDEDEDDYDSDDWDPGEPMYG